MPNPSATSSACGTAARRLALLAGVLAMPALAAATFDQGARRIVASGRRDRFSDPVVVLQKRTPLLSFAAEELVDLLGRCVGREVPVAGDCAGRGLRIVLGDCPLARSAGLDPSAAGPQGFLIRRLGDRVFILGRDSREADPRGNSWGQCYPRGTLSGVYAFLERFAGVRFFFPGDIGTVVPKRGCLELPEVVDISDRPDFADRRFLHSAGRWYEPQESYRGGVKGINLNILRLRLAEELIPFGHGLAYLDHERRFKDHPEYFAMLADGTRFRNRPELRYSGQICFLSGIREEIYQDAKAYLSGRPASSRGLGSWNFNTARPGYFSLMPGDWLYWCGCGKCRRIAPAGREEAYSSAGASQAISDVVWRFTAEVAERLAAEGVPGRVTQMAYHPYDRIPACRIPANVCVQVAVDGPGSRDQRADDRTIRDWARKTGGPVSLWTYPGKHGSKAMPGIPAMLHNRIGRYFPERRKHLFGAFLESETDFYIFNYLNYYVFAKTAWDNGTDLEALLRDHFAAMFGKGAGPMRRFYDALEELWLEVVGNTVDTARGPVARIPTELELWTGIYTPRRLAGFGKRFRQAEAAAAGQPEALARIRFMESRLLEPIRRAAERFRTSQAARGSWRLQVPGRVHLRPLDGGENEVSTVVRVERSDAGLEFSFDCQEPRMRDLRPGHRRRDDPSLFQDSCVEVLLNPTGDRRRYLHYIVNDLGILADYRNTADGPADRAWNGGATATAERRADGWSARLAVPWQDLGEYDRTGFPVNFGRHRSLLGRQPRTAHYQWSLDAGGGFHDLHRFGRMLLKPLPDPNLVRNGDFDAPEASPGRIGDWLPWRSGGKTGGQVVETDPRSFIAGGRSLHLRNTRGMRLNAGQYLQGLRPAARYRLSFFIRTKDIEPGIRGAGAWLDLGDVHQAPYPVTRLTGTNRWHCLSFDFETPAVLPEKPTLGLWIWDAEGEAWFDHVRIEPLPRD